MSSLTLFSLYIILIFLFIGISRSTPIDGEYLGSFKHTNLTMEVIENIELKTCKNDSDCPDYSNGCEIYTRFDGENDVEYRLCDMTFICHKNETCLSLRNASTYYINLKGMEYGISFVNNNTMKNDEFENEDKIILHSCSKSMYKHNLCETDTCINESNCYSKKCENGTCMANKENPASVCRIDWLEKEEKPGMRCRNANGEKCSESDDCDQINVCDDRYSVCASPLIAEDNGKHKGPDYLFLVGVGITIVVILGIVALITIFVMSCIYIAIDELTSILYNVSDDYRQIEDIAL